MKQRFSRAHIIVLSCLGTFAIFVVVVLGKGLKLNPSTTESALLGKSANAFKVNVLQEGGILTGKSEASLSDFAGRPLVLNFWASWCVSCREEAREFEAFWQEHRGEVAVFGIAIQDTPDDAMSFVKTYGKTYPIALDITGSAGIDYGVTGVPETFLITGDGKIAHKISGPASKAELERLLALISK